MSTLDYSKWSAASWKSLVDGGPDPIAFLGVDHRIIYVNHALAALFDTTPEALIGRRCFEICHGSNAPIASCPCEVLLNDRCDHSCDVAFEPLGQIFNVFVKPVLDARDHLMGVLHVSRDITRYVEREQALQAMCEELERRVESRTQELAERLLIERLEVSLLLRFGDPLLLYTDLVSLVQESVDEIAKVLGYDRCSFWEVQGDTASRMGAYEREPGEFPPLPLETTKARDAWMFVAVGEAWEQGRSSVAGVNRCVAGVHALQADEPGYLLLAECHAGRTYYGATMRPEHLQLLCHLVGDMVRRVRSGVKNQQLQRQLLQADHIARLGQLSAGLAHEVSQPLSAALCNAQAALRLLERPAPDIGESVAALTDIVENIRHAGEVIHRTRTLYKGVGRPHAPVSLAAVTRSVLKLLEGALAADEAAVEVSVAPTLPVVSGDAIQLQQVLVNVIRNALDAVRGLDRRVITVTASQPDDHQLELRVRDSGEGLPAGREATIFNSFETSKTDGMGMGLAICREIITQHNGTIRAANATDGGAEFIITLPALPSPPREPRSAPV